jgi:hypothetical protein
MFSLHTVLIVRSRCLTHLPVNARSHGPRVRFLIRSAPFP